jgi:MacB-like periplasmic core domain
MLGIGATTAIFSVINGVLLHPLPYSDPDRLYSVQENGPDFGAPTSYPELEDWRAQNHVFTAMAAYRGANFTLTGDNGASLAPGVVVSANLLSVLQKTPLLGNGFESHDEHPGAARPDIAVAKAALASAYLDSGDRRTATGLFAQAESIRGAHQQLAETYERPLRIMRQRLAAGSGRKSP